MIKKTVFLWIDKPESLQQHSAAIIDMLNGSVQDDGMLGYGSRLSVEDANAFLAGWEWQLKNSCAHILIAQDEAGPCGMAFMRTNSNSNYRHIADLSKGYVAPRMRGTTTLVSLFRHCCERAQTLGVDLFTLDTREGSRALAVWRHFGFESHGVLPDYSRFGGKSHTGHFMHQEVKNLINLLNKRT